MKRHRPVVGYQDVWGNYPGAIAHGRCMSTETWQSESQPVRAKPHWGSGGHQLHIQTPPCYQVTSLKILLKGTKPRKQPHGVIGIKACRCWYEWTILCTWTPVVDYCWLWKLSTGNSSMRSPCTCAGKVEDVLLACEITKCSTLLPFGFILLPLPHCACVPWH